MWLHNLIHLSTPQQAHNIDSTLIQRWWRWINVNDVESTLIQRRVSAGSFVLEHLAMLLTSAVLYRFLNFAVFLTLIVAKVQTLMKCSIVIWVFTVCQSTRLITQESDNGQSHSHCISMYLGKSIRIQRFDPISFDINFRGRLQYSRQTVQHYRLG